MRRRLSFRRKLQPFLLRGGEGAFELAALLGELRCLVGPWR